MSASPEAALRPPLSQWEERLFDHFTQHTEQENTLLSAYHALAASGPDEFVRYLAGMLLEDEQRHHRMFTRLANTILSEATLTPGADDVPPLTHSTQIAELVPLTEQLIALEEDDKVQLARLRRELRDVQHTTLWDLLVQLAERDTEKHLLILRFLQTAARDAARATVH